MTTLSLEDIERITSFDTPRGQILTSPWKPYVYLLDDFVYKGPYLPQHSHIVEKVVKYSKAFGILGSSVVPGTRVVDYLGREWLRFPNLATTPREEWRTKIVIDQEREIQVLEGGLGFSEFSNVSPSLQFEELFGEHLLYTTYLDCALLGRGDTNFRNTLYQTSTQKAFVIDFEFDSHRKGLEHPADVFSRSSKKLRELCEKGFQSSSVKRRVALHFNRYRDLLPLLQETVGHDLTGNYMMIYNMLLK